MPGLPEARYSRSCRRSMLLRCSDNVAFDVLCTSKMCYYKFYHYTEYSYYIRL